MLYATQHTTNIRKNARFACLKICFANHFAHLEVGCSCIIISVLLQATYRYYHTRQPHRWNNFRHEDDVWAWNEDNVTKHFYSNLGSVTYDYKLEQIAMQRAVEIAFRYGHTRSDGSSIDSMFTSFNGHGEGIAAGQGTV